MTRIPLKTHQQNASNKFLYKVAAAAALIFTILVVMFLTYLFSSQPELPPPSHLHLNKTTTSTYTWEVVRYMFVGIAVLAYALFTTNNRSTTTTTTQPEIDHDFHNAPAPPHSYLSAPLLDEVSSLFDDHSESDETQIQNYPDENKIHTWNSQYSRGEPVDVVLAKQTSILHQHTPTTTITRKISGEKPLLLPLRSLKSPQPQNIPETNAKQFTRSISSIPVLSKPLSNNDDGEKSSVRSRNEEFGVEESIVHRSPIPWRSRLGGRIPPLTDINNNSESNTLFRSPSLSSTPSDSNSPSPINLSPSSSSDSQAKSIQDAPPPPPPPPPSSLPKSKLMKSSSSVEPPRLADSGGGQGDVMFLGARGQSVRKIGEKLKQEKISLIEEEKQEFIEKVLVHTTDEDDDTESEEDYDSFEQVVDVVPKKHQEDEEDGVTVSEDVDKKADEFIAKFREQIRLQRIESIRRSTKQKLLRNHSR